MKNSPNLGTKFTCQACDVRYYDLGKEKAVCPMCSAVYTPPKPIVRAKRSLRVGSVG